jgi:choline transporter-like protein 2/4/5
MKKLCGSCAPKVEPEGEDGAKPDERRKCRDVACLALFGVFWFGMFIIALVASSVGDTARLLHGSDYEGKACGGLEHAVKPLIYYPRMNQDLMEASQKGTPPMDVEFYGICVSKCPLPETYICSYDVQSTLDAQAISADEKALQAESKYEDKVWSKGPCWYVPLQTDIMFFRCLPLTPSNKTEVSRCVRPKIEGGGYYAHDASGKIDLRDPDIKKYYYFDHNTRIWQPNEKCKTTEIESFSKSKRPTQPNPLVDKMQATAAKLAQWFGDLQKTAPLIIINGGVLSLIFGFIFLLLLKYCAGPVIWATCLVAFLLVGGLALYAANMGGMLTRYKEQYKVDLPMGVQDDAAKAAADSEEANQGAYKFVAYVAGLLSCVILFVIIFMRKKIKICIGVVREASRAVRSMPSLVVFPVVPFVMLLVLVAYWLPIAALIKSSSSISVSDVTAATAKATAVASGGRYVLNTTAMDAAMNASLSSAGGAAAGTGFGMKAVQPSNVGSMLLWYHLFGLLWTNALIDAISMCSIAGAVSKWYWSKEKSVKEMGLFPLGKAFYNCFRYHMGSLCFGALIIAIIQMIRIILTYIDQNTKGLQDKNKFLKILMKVLQCCMWCLEKVAKFVSRNAYIVISMKGKSFCSATVEAFMLILSNIAQVGIVGVISMIMLLLAKLSITAACGFITFTHVSSEPRYQKGGTMEVSSPVVPCIVTIIMAYFVASTFLGVYELAIDTIMLCYCEDKKVNSSSKKYYMSKELAELTK